MRNGEKMKLSDHFSLDEFVISQTAERLSIDNTPSDEITARMKLLANAVLEPIRKHFGPLHISSGYRCEELNARIGGATASQHTFGEAADIISYSASPYTVSKWVEDNLENFDQCIYEGRWTHISFSNRHLNRKVLLTAVFKNKKATYTSGIINK